MAKYTIFDMQLTPKLPTLKAMWAVLYWRKPDEAELVYIARTRQEAREFIRWCKNNSFEGGNPILQFFKESNAIFENLRKDIRNQVKGNTILVSLKCEHCGCTPSVIYSTPAGILCTSCYSKSQKLN